MEEPSAPPSRQSGLFTGLHPASHQPPFPSQPECLLETQIRSCQSLLKTSQGLPMELSIRGMPFLSCKIPQDSPPARQTSALGFFYNKDAPRPGPLGCFHRAFAPAVPTARPGTFTGHVPSCHSGLDFHVTSSEKPGCPIYTDASVSFYHFPRTTHSKQLLNM